MTNSDPESMPYTILIPRARLTAFLVLVALVLLINHVMLQVFYYGWDAGHWLLRDMFDVDEEENFPTYFSSFILLLSAGLLYAISCRKAEEQDRFTRHWLGLSVIFLALSMDEVAGMHEAVNTVTDFPWTEPLAIVPVVVALIYVRFLIQLPVTSRIGFLAAGCLYVGGAIGVEHLTDWYLESHSMNALGYNLLTPLEEGMEMFGIILFINTLLGYMGRENARISLVIEQDD